MLQDCSNISEKKLDNDANRDMFSKKGKFQDLKNSVQRFLDVKRDPLSRVKHLKFAFGNMRFRYVGKVE